MSFNYISESNFDVFKLNIYFVTLSVMDLNKITKSIKNIFVIKLTFIIIIFA